MKLSNVDWKMSKLIKMHNALQPKNDIDLIYLPRAYMRNKLWRKKRMVWMSQKLSLKKSIKEGS